MNTEDTPSAAPFERLVGPTFTDRISARRRIVIKALRDGCLDCGHGLCAKHQEIVNELTLDPRKWLEKLEAEIFGESA